VNKILQQVLEDFSGILTEKSYPKGFPLHREQNVCHELYFITSGAARSFYHKDGRDITAHFAIDLGVVTAADSFIRKKPSRYNVETLEQSTILSMSRTGLDDYLIQNPQYERTARLFLEELYMDLADRMASLMFFSAQERYQDLIRENPTIVQRVGLGHIASYLGITQETLSRVRAQVL